MSHQSPAQPGHKNTRWRTVRRTNYLFYFLLAAAALVALLAFAIFAVFIVSLRFSLPVSDYLPGIDSLPPAGQFYNLVAALLLAALIFALLARWRLRHNKGFQFINGCPSCHTHDLIRVHRYKYQRLLASLLRTPIRSYACRNCQWQGILIYMIPSKPAVGPPPQPSETGPLPAASAEHTAVDLRTLEKEPAPPPVSDDALGLDQVVPVVSNQTAEEETAEAGATEEAEDQLQEISLEPAPLINIDSPEPAPAAEEASAEFDELLGGSQSPAEQGDIVDHNVTSEENGESEAEPIAEDASFDPEEEKGHSASISVDPPVVQVSVDYQGEKMPRAIVVAPFGLSMRSQPNRSAKIILLLQPDTIVEVLNLENTQPAASWRQIRYQDEVGWVSAAFLKHLQS